MRLATCRATSEESRQPNAWALLPHDPETTRLVLRVRSTMPMSARYRVIRALLGPQEFIMVRAQRRGIRRRAESLAQARRAATRQERSP